jgi:acetyl esterase/lipase
MRLRIAFILAFTLALSWSIGSIAAEPFKVVSLWSEIAPGEKAGADQEEDTTKTSDDLVGGRRLIRLGKVSKPTISIYRPPADKDTGAAVLVCPGGGYHILAMDLEGSEVCEWLNSIGVTGILLKYRVPKREGLEKHAIALQDAQRAMGLVRMNAKSWGIDSQRIGVLGFSAGAHLSAALSCNYQERTYAKVDESDALSCRPDFTILIYPAYLTVAEQGDKLAPELPITTNTPPAFIVMAQDDPIRVENALFYSAALHKAKVPFELHVYPSGGHGYGLRSSKDKVTTWPDRVTDWMGSRGLLNARKSLPVNGATQ